MQDPVLTRADMKVDGVDESAAPYLDGLGILIAESGADDDDAVLAVLGQREPGDRAADVA